MSDAVTSQQTTVREPIGFEEHWDRTHRFDPPELFDRLRANRPLVRMTYPDGHLGWLVTGYALTRQVLSDPRFSHRVDIAHFPVTRNGEPVPPLPQMPGMFIHMDSPEHTRYRKLLTGEFTLRRVGALRPLVTAMARDRLAGLRERGPGADLVADFTGPLALDVLADLLGLSAGEAAALAEYPEVVHAPVVDVAWATEVIQRTIATMGGFVARTKAEQADSLAGRLLASEDLTDEEVSNILMLLFVAGYVTTEGALAMSVFALLSHPEQLAALAADGDYAGAVDELLRYTTVNQYEIFRAATEDVELGGELVRAGETVTLSLPAANRDPSRFPAPDKLDLGRDPAGHLAFGHGVHQCLGQHLGRVVVEVALATLLPALPTLRLAVPATEIPLRARTSVFGVGSLPVTW